MYEKERKEMIEQQNDIMVYNDVTGAIFQRKHFKWEETIKQRTCITFLKRVSLVNHSDSISGENT